ncbi:MAG: formate dehydrogenase, partial [Helicobacteraceae bacterium]|nr:formate dehydrogenase [Helicobacteraceae bacterium]
MSEQTNERREFFKRASNAALAIGAGAAVVVGTTQTYARGETDGHSGVAVGRSRKNEILYRKTPQWEAFYKA